MAVLGRLLVSSAERLDLPDFLSIDSYTQGDFKYLMRSFVGGETPYILKGFDVINPGAAIGTQNISIRVADSVAYYPGSLAGPFFHGLEEGNSQAAPLIPELRKNATNYVYLTFTTSDAAQDTRAFWDPDKEAGVGGEFTQDVNTQTVLSVEANVSVSSFPENTVPVCIVEVGANFITSIEDSRDLMFRLGSGGINPNPLDTYQFRSEPSAAYERDEPSTSMSNALDPNSFQGGDKNIQSLKEWMDVVMTKLLELSGTTYWYEDTTTLSLVNIFKDALATSIKSKGLWQSSDITPGLLTWTEDIVIQSVSDSKTIFVRDGNKTLLNDQVLYFKQDRGENINTGSVDVEWFNGLNYVDGTLGSFENLTKGDWVRKASDSDDKFLRVEEFYAATALGGGVATPANALSIKLSDTYAGTSELSQGIYVKGVYLNTDLVVADRDDTALTAAGGDLYWLAMRSDTIMNVSDITSTQLTIDITGHDGSQALCTQVAHGLLDKQRITIAGSTNFDGTYQIEVVDADSFYIQISGGPHADELAQTAFYATVTTAITSTVDGLQLESANHGFDTDQKITISNTTNYNGAFDIFVASDTTFTIPVPSLIANETSGDAAAVNIYVRTDLGPTKLSQGENKQIGEVESENIMSFIGMDNTTQTYPLYSISPIYDVLNGTVNYNSDITDNLTQRASKLTAMMADKAQDKTISENADWDTVVNTTNGSAQDITFTGAQSMVVSMPSSDNNGTISLTGTLSLQANQVAYYSVDRNAAFSVASLAALTIAAPEDVPVDENVRIFAYRIASTDIFLWDGTLVPVGSLPSPAIIALNANQDRTLKLIGGGTWSWDSGTGNLSFTSDAYIQVPGLADARNTIQQSVQSPITLAAGEVAYVTINRDTGATDNLTVSISAIASLALTADIVVIARRIGSDVIVGTGSFTLKDGEFLELDGALAEINRYHGQLAVKPVNPITDRVSVSGSDIAKLSGSQLSLEQKNLLLSFDGAVIDFGTGEVFESDGVTPFLGGANDFTPATIGSNEYFYYSVSVLPNTANADNTISGQVLVIPATSSNAVLASAPKAAFPSAGLKLANIYVQEDGGGGILNIDHANIIQLGVGGGSGGSGNANADLTRYQDRLNLAPFEYANTNIAEIDEDDQLDGASTATFDIPTGNFKFADSTAQVLLSLQQLDQDFLDEGLDVGTVELVGIWDLDNIDTGATYEISRDAGGEFQAITMNRVGASDTYRGLHTFTDEASNAFNQEYAVANADSLKDLDDGTVQEISQKFTVAATTVYKNVITYINKNQASSTGRFCLEIVQDDSGAPSTDINDIVWTSASQNIDDLAVGNNVVNVSTQFVMTAGDYHLIVRPDDAYRVAYTADNNDKISVRMDSSAGPTPNLREWNGTVWSAEIANETAVYRLEGRVLDVRIRITSAATAGDKFLSSYGLFYKYEDGIDFTRPVFRELFSFDGTVDNDNEFTLTNFMPDSRLLMCFALGTGQVFRYGDFVLDGHKVIFPPNTFNVVGTVELEFFQIQSVDGVASNIHDALLTANHLGSTDASIDKSISGRGIILRNDNGDLVELGLDGSNNWTFNPL